MNTQPVKCFAASPRAKRRKLDQWSRLGSTLKDQCGMNRVDSGFAIDYKLLGTIQHEPQPMRIKPFWAILFSRGDGRHGGDGSGTALPNLTNTCVAPVEVWTCEYNIRCLPSSYNRESKRPVVEPSHQAENSLNTWFQGVSTAVRTTKLWSVATEPHQRSLVPVACPSRCSCSVIGFRHDCAK